MFIKLFTNQWTGNLPQAIPNDNFLGEFLKYLESAPSGSNASFDIPENIIGEGINLYSANLKPQSTSHYQLDRKEFNRIVMALNQTTNEYPNPSSIIEQPLSESSTNQLGLSSRQIFEEQEKFKNQFLFLAKDSTFEFGCLSDTDRYFSNAVIEFRSHVKEWLEELFLENIDDANITNAILRTLAHQDYNIVYPQGVLMAIAAMRQNDVEVKENGIRCFENWENPACVNILKNLSIPEIPWLNDYLDSVIETLMGLMENVTSC